MPSRKQQSRLNKDTVHKISIDYSEYKRLQKDCKNRTKKKNGHEPVKMYSKSFYGLLIFGIIFGVVLGLIVGLFNPLHIDLNKKFDFTIQTQDFYVIDSNDEELYQNASYRIIKIEGKCLYFDKTTWNILKNFNSTEFVSYYIENGIFFNMLSFIMADDDLDSHLFSLQYYPICLFTEMEITIRNADDDELNIVYFNLLDKFVTENPDLAFTNYPFKADQYSDNININIFGISYDFITNDFVNAFISVNGQEITIIN